MRWLLIFILLTAMKPYTPPREYTTLRTYGHTVEGFDQVKKTDTFWVLYYTWQKKKHYTVWHVTRRHTDGKTAKEWVVLRADFGIDKAEAEAYAAWRNLTANVFTH